MKPLLKGLPNSERSDRVAAYNCCVRTLRDLEKNGHATPFDLVARLVEEGRKLAATARDKPERQSAKQHGDHAARNTE